MEFSAFTSFFILSFFTLLAIILIGSAIISFLENEKIAGLKLLGFLIPTIFAGYFAGLLEYEWKSAVAIGLSLIILLMLYLFLKKPLQSKFNEQGSAKQQN